MLAPVLAVAVPCPVWAGWDPQGDQGHSSAQTTEHQDLHSLLADSAPSAGVGPHLAQSHIITLLQGVLKQSQTL